MKRQKPCISHRKSQTLSMLGTLWLPLRLKMGKFSQAFVWKGRVVFSIYVPKGLPFSICIKKLVRLRLSVLSPFVTSHLMVDHLACLVELVENF